MTDRPGEPLPPDQERRLTAAIEGIEGFGPVRERTVVASGPGRAVVRVDDGRTRLAVRIRPARVGAGPSLDSIAEAIRAASAIGVAPPVRLVDPDAGVWVTAWAPGEAWTESDLRRPDRLEALARALARFHAAQADVEPLDLVGFSRDYRERATGAAFDRGLFAALDALDEAVRRFETGTSSSGPVHGDVTAANVVGMPRPVLVDWEYSGAGDPVFDLATVSALHGLDRASRSEFLRAYRAAGGIVPGPGRRREAERLVVLLARVWAKVEVLERPGDLRAAAWLRRAESLPLPELDGRPRR